MENIMSSKKSIISIAVGSAFAATLGVVPVVSAADSPFTLQSLDKGYLVADAGGKKSREGKCGGEGTCGEGRCGAAMADTNKDGKVTKEEWTAHHNAMFEHMDANKDGVIDKSEMERGEMAKKKK
jgi:uncharacterized low-complexity protein